MKIDLKKLFKIQDPEAMKWKIRKEHEEEWGFKRVLKLFPIFFLIRLVTRVKASGTWMSRRRQ